MKEKFLTSFGTSGYEQAVPKLIIRSKPTLYSLKLSNPTCRAFFFVFRKFSFET